jgi:hypothetical protein
MAAPSGILYRLCVMAALAGSALAQPPLVPLLWTQGQPAETIRQAVREVAEGGNTGFVWESRPHPDYLGPQWWSDLRVAIGEAKRLGLEVWIFDEWMYPSGVAGGKVVARNPEFALHTLEERTISVQGPVAEKEWDIPVPLTSHEQIVSVVAFPQRPREGQAPVSLTGGSKVRWAAPAGRWRICWSVSRWRAPQPGWSMANMIDVMNPQATAEFIRLTHEATYEQFRNEFGKTIKGFFSDETGFRNVDSYQSLPGKPGAPMPWSPSFAAYFQKLKGYDITGWLPALWYDLGPKSRATRFDFVDACSRAMAEHFFKPQQEWCHRHGVRLIGHLVEDNYADHNLGYGPGHWFRSMRYFDIPGIDIVGYQVTPGMDSGAIPWRVNSTPWDAEFFSFGLPAMARGAALLQGTREIFSEAFGAYGWGQGLRMTKWIADWHIVNGISVLSPHAYTMKYNDPDCPQQFNRTSGNPQWRYYRDWTREFRPLQQLIADTDPVYDAAVLYTAESAWVGEAQEPAQVVRALETNQISTVVIPYDGISAVRNRVRTIVLPYARFVPAEAMERLAEFAESGGTVIALEAWPQGSVDARGDEKVKAAIGRLKSARSAMLVPRWELPAQFPARRVESFPVMNSVVTAFRKGRDAQWLVLHNRSLSGTASGHMVLSGAPRHAALYDPAAGGYRAMAHRVENGRLVIDVEMPPYALWCVRLSDELLAVRKAPAYENAELPPPSWTVSRATDDAGSQFELVGQKTELEDWRRWAGMESYAGTMRYRTTLFVNVAQYAVVALDAGRVEEIAELTVNGKRLGAKIYPPYQWDISGAIRNGENEIILDVTNTALARWHDPFSHGDAVSGLLGPVRLLRGK